MANNKWFIAYSSSMLDCTKNIKQKRAVQNYSATVSKNIQLFS